MQNRIRLASVSFAASLLAAFSLMSCASVAKNPDTICLSITSPAIILAVNEDDILQYSAAAELENLDLLLKADATATTDCDIDLALIPAGEFVMGGEEYMSKPKHRVKITKPFYMGIYEVTQAQYEAVMGENPSVFVAPNNPVHRIRWCDAVEFCKKLSAKTGRIVRLPTEAEWEYAARAGSIGEHYGKLDDIAWYENNSREMMHPVGQKKPNAFGLFDMLGNVGEWCSDWYGRNYYSSSPVKNPTGPATGEVRVIRGGSFALGEYGCRPATRHADYPIGPFSIPAYGFRVVVECEN